MLTLGVIHTVQTSGINWAQALAIWVPIVLGIFTLGGIVYKGFQHIAEAAVEKFASTLNVKFKDIDDHLLRQDSRMDRIDRNTRKDSR